MGLGKTLVIAPVLCALAACGTATASNNDTSTNTAAPVTANAVAQTAVSDPTAFKVGTNLSTIQWWDGNRPFMNLLYGTGGWTMISTSTWASQAVPPEDLDANGWVKSVPAGYAVQRGLSVPVAGGNFICRFQGNGQLQVSGASVSNVVVGSGQTTFTLAPTYPNPQSALLRFTVDPTNYIRNIDCREASAPTTGSISQEFLTAAQGFKVIRFMKWALPAVEHNSGTSAAWGGGTQANPNYLVTWATRNKPGDADYTSNDGVPVEVMMEAANDLNADPWFAMPWNADDNYITQFATYVRDHLPAGHQVYVEESNEVWNGGYAVSVQSKLEGIAEQLPSVNNPATVTGGPLERYAEKTEHVMDIWKNVFAATGQSSQLVRVAAWQHVQPYYSDQLLAYMNLYQHVDALATAPYWGSGTGVAGLTLDQIMTSYLPGEINNQLNFAAQNKAVAQKYNLRYVTYEGGQSVVLSNNLPLEQQIERDPRMTDLYKSFISQWQSQIGDTLTLFTLHAPISQYGGFGMYEYVGQPLSQAPKMQAVQQFLGISTTTASAGSTTPTTSTITCPDGTVISSTSTCPVTTTTITCPDGTVILSTSTCPAPSVSGSTTGGKRNTKGGGKGKYATV